MAILDWRTRQRKAFRERGLVMARMAALALALFCWASTTTWGQQPTSSAPQEPRIPNFTTGVTETQVTFVVQTKSGQIVTDLTKDDFLVFESGRGGKKEQNINTFREVELPLPHEGKPQIRPLPQNAATNDGVGRFYVIVLDNWNILVEHSHSTIVIASTFVEKYMGPQDWAAVVTTAGDQYQWFTRDKTKLLRAINSFRGRKAVVDTPPTPDYIIVGKNDDGSPRKVALPQGPDPIHQQKAYQAGESMTRLANIARLLGYQPIAGRKSVLFVSSGIDVNLQDTWNQQIQAEDVSKNIAKMIATANRSNVTLYPVDPRGLPIDGGVTAPKADTGAQEGTGNFAKPLETDSSVRNSLDNLRDLAESTGGHAGIQNNAFEKDLDRIVRENSNYYQLGYTSSYSKKDGSTRQIEIRMRDPKYREYRVIVRKGYQVESRQEVEARRAAEKIQGKPINLAIDINVPAAQRVSGLLDVSVPVGGGLTMSVQPAVFKGTGKNGQVIIALELSGETLHTPPQADGNRIREVATGIRITRIENDEIVFNRTSGVKLDLDQQKGERFDLSGWRGLVDTELPPGQYLVRTALADAGLDGKDSLNDQGGIITDLVVPDFEGEDVSSSSIVVAGKGTVLDLISGDWDRLNRCKLTTPMTATRVFVQLDVLEFCVEVYAKQFGKELYGHFELLGSDGKRVAAYTKRLGPDDFKDGAAIYAQKVQTVSLAPDGKSVDILAPGMYELRFSVYREDDQKNPAWTESMSFELIENLALRKALGKK